MAAFEQAIAAFRPDLPLAIGFSGGADSTALLIACAQRWPGQVVAFHVHHGLQVAAEAFERHGAETCRRVGVPLLVRRVDGRAAPGDSPEASARTARYEAFRTLAHMDTGYGAIESIALGHHADDQVETLLLALTRGAGLPGLAAMPRVARRHGLRFHRPLLSVTASDIRAWLAARAFEWIDDPTNLDVRFTRNRIRTDLLPALERVSPSFRATFARTAAHAAEAQTLLAELARQDLDDIGTPPRIDALQRLSRARQANVLRHWLRHAFGRTPSAAQLGQLLDQIAACATRGHAIRLRVADGIAERRGAVLDWYNAAPLPDASR